MAKTKEKKTKVKKKVEVPDHVLELGGTEVYKCINILNRTYHWHIRYGSV